MAHSFEQKHARNEQLNGRPSHCNARPRYNVVPLVTAQRKQAPFIFISRLVRRIDRLTNSLLQTFFALSSRKSCSFSNAFKCKLVRQSRFCNIL